MSIELRSRRGAVGTGPLAVALRERSEGLLGVGRAAAGKRAARAGAVQWLDVSPGAARAEVRDEMTGHGVVARLELAPLLPGDREVLLDIAHAHPELPARLVAGQFPEDVARELEAQEISLLPRGPSDLSHDCSCHDWPGPCTHVAALLYVLVEAVDAEPATLLTLRGLTLEDLAPPPTTVPAAPAEPEAVRESDDETGHRGADPAPAPRFDPSRADASLLVEALGADVAGVLARFYGTAAPDRATRRPPTG